LRSIPFLPRERLRVSLKFMMSVRQTVDAIEKAPLRFPVVFRTIRKASVAKFPFFVSDVTDGETMIFNAPYTFTLNFFTCSTI
jgi:hypothetical protein